MLFTQLGLLNDQIGEIIRPSVNTRQFQQFFLSHAEQNIVRITTTIKNRGKKN